MTTKKRKPPFTKEQLEVINKMIDEKVDSRPVVSFLENIWRSISITGKDAEKAPEKLSKWLKNLGIDNTLKL